MNETTRLTEADERIIARARALADAHTTEALRAATGTPAGAGGGEVSVNTVGTAQFLLGELAAIIARLDGGKQPNASFQPMCARCGRGTRSARCARCGGPASACARCGRCPDCDDPAQDEEEDDG